MSNLFGWDLLYGSVEKDIKSNQDILVCLGHLVLVSNGFKCIGLGESKNMDGSEPKSEALPKGWNDDYALRYVYQGRLYNLKGTRLEDGILINMVRVDERTVSSIQLNTRVVVKRTGPLNEMVPDSENVAGNIKKQLIDAVTTSTKSQDSSCQTAPQAQPPQRSPYFSPISPLCEPRGFAQPNNPLAGPGVGVGSSDLDPFGGLGGIGPLRNPHGVGGGGGMLFQGPGQGMGGPFGPPVGIPPGSLPPGARFDPFRPPGTDRYRPGPRRPDNDEFPPPGFDDMYM